MRELSVCGSTKPRGSWLRASAAAAGLVALVACSAKSSGPSTWSYAVNFHSVASAISTDTLEVSVYDATLPDTGCAVLVQQRRSNAELPKPLVSVPATSLCDLAGGQGQLTVPYGTYQILVVGKHKGQDWLVGCNTQHVTRDEDPGTLQIDLTNFDDSVLVAPTACQTLSAHCSGGC
jgi:hypothetical protein